MLNGKGTDDGAAMIDRHHHALCLSNRQQGTTAATAQRMSTKDEDDGVELHPLVPSKTSFSQDEDPSSPRHALSPLSPHSPNNPQLAPRRSERGTKLFFLALACTFSIGSHYSQDCLGPLKDILKSELHISDTQMSLILGSHLVANTILPILAGVLVARFGTLKSSLFATGGVVPGTSD